MTHFPQPNANNRATRIQLGTSALALVKNEDGQRRAKLQTVSTTGGLLQLSRAMEEGDFVEVAFQTLSGPVHGMAEMLQPRKLSDQGCLQAFRFVALEDDDHRNLSFAVNTTTERNFLLGSNQFSKQH